MDPEPLPANSAEPSHSHLRTAALGALSDAPSETDAGTAGFHSAISRPVPEPQPEHALKLEASRNMARLVAHHFNNLIGVVLGNAELVQLDSLTTRQRDALQEILQAGERANAITRQLQAFGHVSESRPHLRDLNDLVFVLEKKLRRALGSAIAMEVRPLAGGAPVQVDLSAIELVLMNLANNSRYAMPKGGKFTVTISRKVPDAADSSQSPAPPDDFIELSVHDTGWGIPAEHLTRIFEPLFSTKSEGLCLGLGLATVQGIVEKHHGRITVESQPGRGTIFHILLPRADESQCRTPSTAEAEATEEESETILLVEDEPSFRLLVTQMLEKAGYQVIESSTAAATLKIWPQLSEQVSLLLTDVVLRSGVNGNQLVEKIKAQQPDLKVVYMSGFPLDVLESQGLVLREGVNYLPKPFTPAQLTSVLQANLPS